MIAYDWCYHNRNFGLIGVAGRTKQEHTEYYTSNAFDFHA